MSPYRIVVNLSERKLYLNQGSRAVKTYPIAIGAMLSASPVGKFRIINKVPHPGGPYGVYWLGLSKPHYGIHGTNDPSSIGKRVSHGCIRMYNRDVTELARMVQVGTEVQIRR